MPWVGFEPTFSAGERPKTYALDRAVTGTGSILLWNFTKYVKTPNFRDCEPTEDYCFDMKFIKLYRGADKSLAQPTSQCILFDGENISFDGSLVIYRVIQNDRRNFNNLSYTIHLR